MVKEERKDLLDQSVSRTFWFTSCSPQLTAVLPLGIFTTASCTNTESMLKVFLSCIIYRHLLVKHDYWSRLNNMKLIEMFSHVLKSEQGNQKRIIPMYGWYSAVVVIL